jgi:hypothetical protein
MAKEQILNKQMIAFIVLFLLVVLFFMKSTVFSQLFQTIMGRGFLILLIIFITYCNTILGLLFVIFLIMTYLSEENVEYNGYNNVMENFTTPVKLKALEGLDLLGLEHSIKKGKDSNTIQVEVDNLQQNANNVMPYEESMLQPAFLM